MRKEQILNRDWQFTDPEKEVRQVNIPHTWNAKDGQDGGNDYFRGPCYYEKQFSCPEFSPEEQVYLEFAGVNASATVILNGKQLMHHDGGYSTFRCHITPHLQAENCLRVEVDNSANRQIYPQKADFTFYGGIYRDVKLLVVNQHHFDLEHYGGPGIAVTPTVEDATGLIRVQTWDNCPQGQVEITLLDGEGSPVAAGNGRDLTLEIPNVHLWDGLEDPYLYTCQALLTVAGEPVDKITAQFGVRTFSVDPKKGFFLNGRSYPLHGVSRHQDRKDIGNALGKEHHDEDMALILEVGANTVRLAHYQHDQYFYDLCDRYGLIVWAEIPYISEHMEAGRENTVSQMKELIIQNYNHPCIVTWGISNEITISTKNKQDMLSNHRELNDLVHSMDPTRPTSLACYAVCAPFNRVAHITDLVGWNLYLGWYVPGLFLNDLWIDFFHFIYPKRCLSFSEYGCEGMPNLHSRFPRRGDHTEEYQAKYHAYMLRCFAKRPFMWANYVWNMFDFAADARNQGGEPGMNHKGLVTFDRKTKKDSFYLYKAYWTTAPMVHIAGKRFQNRTGKYTKVTVYANYPVVTLYANGKKLASQAGSRVFTFRVKLEETLELRAVAGTVEDTATLHQVKKPDKAYKLNKRARAAGGGNWT